MFSGFDLTGKRAFITGSSRGIGKAAAQLMSQMGAEIILHGVRKSAALEDTAASLPGKYSMLTADLGQINEVEALCSALSAPEQVPDILVLNASIQEYTGLGNFNSQDFLDMFRTNVESSFIILQRLLPLMRERAWGRVIFVGSINGMKPASRLAVYGAAKAALMNVAKTAAMENAPYNITVNTILPGVIETDRNRKVLSDPEFAESLKEKIPMHRFGSSEECAALIGFLASDAAGYITGAEIPIAGGWQL